MRSSLGFLASPAVATWSARTPAALIHSCRDNRYHARSSHWTCATCCWPSVAFVSDRLTYNPLEIILLVFIKSWNRWLDFLTGKHILNYFWPFVISIFNWKRTHSLWSFLSLWLSFSCCLLWLIYILLFASCSIKLEKQLHFLHHLWWHILSINNYMAIYDTHLPRWNYQIRSYSRNA